MDCKLIQLNFVLFLLHRCTECEVDEIWEDEVPDVENSVALDGVTAAEMKRVHVSGVDEDLEGKNSFDADVAFYQCLEVCCATGEFTT